MTRTEHGSSAATRARLETLRRALRTFPESVAPVAYARAEPPVCAPLSALVNAQQLRGLEPIEDRVLEKFVRRLLGARPDLSEAEVLELAVPTASGDQEVFLARLGKWRFELRQLERDAQGAER